MAKSGFCLLLRRLSGEQPGGPWAFAPVIIYWRARLINGQSGWPCSREVWSVRRLDYRVSSPAGQGNPSMKHNGIAIIEQDASREASTPRL
jgi:hypothetical protein